MRFCFACSLPAEVQVTRSDIAADVDLLDGTVLAGLTEARGRRWKRRSISGIFQGFPESPKWRISSSPVVPTNAVGRSRRGRHRGCRCRCEGACRAACCDVLGRGSRVDERLPSMSDEEAPMLSNSIAPSLWLE